MASPHYVSLNERNYLMTSITIPFICLYQRLRLCAKKVDKVDIMRDRYLPNNRDFNG